MAPQQKQHDTLGGAILDLASPTVDESSPSPESDDVFEDRDRKTTPSGRCRDVSFEIKSGETVGIIGSNGAGKSTLLKILSRITQPTRGTAVVNGRVSSLLEVGTGFHPDLTGRENVYLNGAILGMSRKEIDRKFDDIVDFSDVGKFIDTPVKRYSSGMALRLAFSVAAHLEPEILMVDEVLAVGDIRFQKKCLSKMGEVASAGRTVLYVAHNMPAISRLCQRAILMGNGRVVQDGPVHEVISTYLNSGLGTSAVREWPDLAQRARRGYRSPARGARRRTRTARSRMPVDIRRPFRIEMEYEVLKSGYVLLAALYVCKRGGRVRLRRAGSGSRMARTQTPGRPLHQHGLDTGKPAGGRDAVRGRQHDHRWTRSSSSTRAAAPSRFWSPTAGSRTQQARTGAATFRGPCDRCSTGRPAQSPTAPRRGPAELRFQETSGMSLRFPQRAARWLAREIAVEGQTPALTHIVETVH